MRIEGLREFRGRNPRGYFADLPWEVRQRAYGWLHHFCKRWGPNLTRWRFAILVGQAKRLARTSAEERSAWGRSMLAKRGGYATQSKYRQTGRVGLRHPARRAALISAAKRKVRKQQQEDEHRRQLLGLPPKRRSKWLLT